MKIRLLQCLVTSTIFALGCSQQAKVKGNNSQKTESKDPTSAQDRVLSKGTDGSDTIGNPDVGDPPGNPALPPKVVNPLELESLTCSQESALPAARKLPILTNYKVEKKLSQLFPASISKSAQVQVYLSGLPPDLVQKKFDSEIKLYTAQKVEKILDVALAIGEAMSKSQAAREEFYTSHGISCPANSLNLGTCVDSFVQGLGSKTYRRPLTVSEANLHKRMYTDASKSSAEAGYIVLVSSFLTTKEFLFVQPSKDSAGKLDAWGLAAKLASETTGGLPDAQLRQKAADGSLKNEATFAAEVDRLMKSGDGRAYLRHFAKQWMNAKAYTAPQDASLQLDSEAKRSSLIAAASDEIGKVFEHTVFEGKGSFETLWKTDVVFPSHPALAAIYGVEQGNGTAMASMNRAGIHTRMGPLMSDLDSTSPPHRGYFARTMLLCGQIGALPEGIDTSLPQNAPDVLSSRQYWDLLTGKPACAGCHTKMNTLGYAMDRYDMAGRYRMQETVENRKTKVKSTLPIDDAVEVDFGGGETHSFAGANGFADSLVQSPQAQACFATRWLQFQSGIFDGRNCQTKSVFMRLKNQDASSLEAALKAYYLSTEFRL